VEEINLLYCLEGEPNFEEKIAVGITSPNVLDDSCFGEDWSDLIEDNLLNRKLIGKVSLDLENSC